MISTSTPASPPSAGAHRERSLFVSRMRATTYGVLLFTLVIHLLDKFRDILQPLFVAVFLSFVMHPIHRWLIQRGVRSSAAYGVILAVVILVAWGVGSMMYSDVAQIVNKLDHYKLRFETAEQRLETMAQDFIARLPFEVPGLRGHFLRQIEVDPDQMTSAARAVLSRVGDVGALAALTFVYLLFMVVEKVSFPIRLALALGEQHGTRIMEVVASINQAISDYIAVKTLASALAGLLSYTVLAMFGVDFAVTWGILIFAFNYIPYLGSLIAVGLPILLSFLQFDEIWKGIVITLLLIGIQQIIGTLVEPRMAGQRLDVSPILIVLALAFWWAVWGIIGAILAVPLLVIVKIILDNIPETKPIATLISNR